MGERRANGPAVVRRMHATGSDTFGTFQNHLLHVIAQSGGRFPSVPHQKHLALAKGLEHKRRVRRRIDIAGLAPKSVGKLAVLKRLCKLLHRGNEFGVTMELRVAIGVGRRKDHELRTGSPAASEAAAKPATAAPFEGATHVFVIRFRESEKNFPAGFRVRSAKNRSSGEDQGEKKNNQRM